MTPQMLYRSALPGMAWPGFPNPNAAQKLALLFQIEQGQWRAAEKIATAQFEQARRVAAFAAETAPYYRDMFGHGFSAASLDMKSWRDLPILSRKTLHEAEAELRSQRMPTQHGRTVELRTSGSTGVVVRVLGTGLTQLYWEVFCLRDHLWHRRDLRQKLVTISFQRDPALKGMAVRRGSSWGPATDDVTVTGPASQIDMLLDVEFLAEALVAEQPGYFLTHPSLMLELAQHCLGKGIRLPGLLEARTMSESSSEILRDTCREAWEVPLVDMYTCHEAGYLALQCPDHEHLHVQSENVLLEVVDATGRTCGPGEIGRVLITALHNFATPLIRYELGDYAEVGAPCPCGRGLPVLKRVMGRYRNLLTLPDGSRRWPLMGYEGTLTDIAPIELMQMIQTSLEEIKVRLVMPRPLDGTETTALTEFIQGNLGYPFHLSFEYVDTIRNPVNGKVEQFISMLESTP